MVWSPVLLDRGRLARLAIAAGFGHELDLDPVDPGSRKCAYYVSKYITKATDQRADVPWWGERVDFKTGEVTEGLVDGRYRTWSMSRRWGKSMAVIRAEGAAYAAGIELKRAAEGLALALASFGAEIIPSVAALPDG